MSDTKKKIVVGDQPIYDASSLGAPKIAILGFQHVFAMFGATVLVPLLTGLDVSSTLLFAGLGTLLFHFLTKRKVPAFLGSSFAFLGGYAAIAPLNADGSASPLLPYACFGVACAGLVYLVLAGLFRVFGANKVMKFFPPVDCTGCHRCGYCLQHLGQGNGQDHPDPSWCYRILFCCGSYRKHRLYTGSRGSMDRLPDSL